MPLHTSHIFVLTVAITGMPTTRYCYITVTITMSSYSGHIFWLTVTIAGMPTTRYCYITVTITMSSYSGHIFWLTVTIAGMPTTRRRCTLRLPMATPKRSSCCCRQPITARHSDSSSNITVRNGQAAAAGNQSPLDIVIGAVI